MTRNSDEASHFERGERHLFDALAQITKAVILGVSELKQVLKEIQNEGKSFVLSRGESKINQ